MSIFMLKLQVRYAYFSSACYPNLFFVLLLSQKIVNILLFQNSEVYFLFFLWANWSYCLGRRCSGNNPTIMEWISQHYMRQLSKAISLRLNNFLFLNWVTGMCLQHWGGLEEGVPYNYSLLPHNLFFCFIAACSRCFWSQVACNSPHFSYHRFHKNEGNNFLQKNVNDCMYPKLIWLGDCAKNSSFLHLSALKEEEFYEINIPLNFTATMATRIHGLACWFDVLFNGRYVRGSLKEHGFFMA